MNMVMQTDFEYKQSRQLMIEKKLGCKTISINPDAADLTFTHE